MSMITLTLLQRSLVQGPHFCSVSARHSEWWHVRS